MPAAQPFCDAFGHSRVDPESPCSDGGWPYGHWPSVEGKIIAPETATMYSLAASGGNNDIDDDPLDSGVFHVADVDYIIVGAGSAGCVLADRLSADGTNHMAFLGCWQGTLLATFVDHGLASEGVCFTLRGHVGLTVAAWQCASVPPVIPWTSAALLKTPTT